MTFQVLIGCSRLLVCIGPLPHKCIQTYSSLRACANGVTDIHTAHAQHHSTVLLWCLRWSRLRTRQEAAAMGNALPERRFEAVPEIVGAPTGKLWYHGNINDSAAEQRLKSAAEQDGNYLVYDFYTGAGPVHGNYILLVFCGRKLYRWKISRTQDGRYILGEDEPGMESYASVRNLIKAHRGLTGKPLRLANGRSVKLTHDYVTRASVAGIPVGHAGHGQRRWNSIDDTNRPKRERPASKFRRRVNTMY